MAFRAIAGFVSTVLVGVGSIQIVAKLRKRRRRADVTPLKPSLLTAPGRTICVVTTAALPWRTGTAVNPLLRVAYLATDPGRKVILVVPWLSLADQKRLFPPGLYFNSKLDQTLYIKKWSKDRTGFEPRFKIYYYDAIYYERLGSIFATGDLPDVIPDGEADVAILEEPEHLNWFQFGTRWTAKFKHVIGIIHTNYLAYIKDQNAGAFGAINEIALSKINNWVCRIHCHKVIKLSDAVQQLDRSVTCNVHGVAHGFLRIGEAMAVPKEAGAPRFSKGVYFIGKAVWGKGYRQLLDVLSVQAALPPPSKPLHVDVVGAGEDLEEIRAEAEQKGLDMEFLGGKDHADESLWPYQVLLNPSISDVVATTTAEALAMGKWVVAADLPCNAFFKQFDNCRMYSSPQQCARQLDAALASEPRPMSAESLSPLTWEAATQRLLDVGSIAAEEWPRGADAATDTLTWHMYRSVAGMRVLRDALGISSPFGGGDRGDAAHPKEEATPELQLLAAQPAPA